MALGRPPLNVQPQGLLGFLQTKTGGKYPQTLNEDFVQPTWDLARHYVETNAEFAVDIVLNEVAGSQLYSTILVAQPYWQYINWWGVTWQGTNAGDSCVADLIIYEPQQGRVLSIGTPRGSYFLNAGATAARAYDIIGEGTEPVLARAEGIWLPPQWGLGIRQTRGTVVGAPQFFCCVSRARFR